MGVKAEYTTCTGLPCPPPQTRGTRHQPASRCAAQGYYILRSPEAGEEEGIKPIEKADENLPRDFPVYFAYAIAVPEEKDFGDVQEELKIVPRGSFSIQGESVYIGAGED